MATIADNLQKIIDIKKDIKDAINNKGVTVSDSDKFDTYASKIMEIKQGGGGDCDPDHYLEYEWITDGVEDCQGDDKGYLYIPMVTLDGKEYELKDGPQRVQITEKDNEDCKCHQLKCITTDGSDYEVKKGTSDTAASVLGTAHSNKTYYIYDSEDWQYTTNFLLTQTNIERIVRLPKFDSATVMRSMFDGCSSVTEINMENLVTKNVTSIRSMFSGCKSLRYIDMSTWDTSGIENSSNAVSAFASNCSSLEYINMDGIDASNIYYGLFEGTTICQRFYGRNMYVENNTSYAATPWYNLLSKLTYIDISGSTIKQTSGTSLASLFGNATNLKEAKLNNITFENVNTLTNTFYKCNNVKKMDLSYWKFPGVTSLSSMFGDCTSMEELNLSGWNLDNVTFNYQAFGYSKLSNLRVIYACDCSETTVQKIKDALKQYNSHVEVVTCEEDEKQGTYTVEGSDFCSSGSSVVENKNVTIYNDCGDGENDSIAARYNGQIKINNNPYFTIYIKDDEVNGDNLYASELDTPLDRNNNNFRASTAGTGEWKQVYYFNDGGEHTIYLRYIKSTLGLNAKCYIAIPE